MSKVILELAPQQVEKLVERLSMKDKIRLSRRLEEETSQERIKQVISHIRQRAKKNPIPQKEIIRICKDVRKELYEEKIKSAH